MSVRVHELAKELKLSSKELIDRLKTLKVNVKNHMSVLTSENVKVAKNSFKKPATSSKSAGSSKSATISQAVKPKAPAARVEPPSQASSIESVKREFLLQRVGIKTTPSTPETKKSTAAPFKKAPTVTPAKPKGAPTGFKKTSKPSAPPSSGDNGSSVLAAPAATIVEPLRVKKIQIETPVAVKDLAAALFVKPSDLIQRLIKLNIFASINQSVNFEIAAKITSDMGYELEKPQKPSETPVTEAAAHP